ncbi:MAG: S8 family serine peptidase [Chitinophagales bacterium]|nr:S8 family serine peptidase [Chitinophagales bacterium]
MKCFLPVLFALLSNFILFAQETAPKLDLYTQRMLKSPDWKFDDINLFVKGDLESVKVAAERNGCYWKYGYKDISAVNVPLKNLNQFLADPAILRAENGDLPMTMLTDSAIITNAVQPIHDGDAPLNQPYKGDGVIVGLIDDGINYQHQDFKKPNGETRVRFIWDQTTSNTNSPAPYNYGRQWTEADINNGTCTHEERLAAFGHGTHVAGIACGNGSASNAYTGMAPNADIIAVAFNYNRPFLSTFVDAVDYIFKKADAMGKPCVINASLGTYIGSRDGKDLAAEMVDALLEERGGRALVAALGNAGQIKMHLGYEVTSDTAFTWFKYNTSSGDIFFQVWADTADMDSVYFSFGPDDVNSNFYFGNVGFHNIRTEYPNIYQAGNPPQIKNYLMYDGTTFIGVCSTQVTLTEGRYLLEVLIEPSFINHQWRFITTGKGRFDLWSARNQMGFADMVYQAPDPFANPSYANYRQPDTLQTLVSSFTCSEKVISVGNFSNKNQYIDVYGDTVYLNVTPGALYKDDRADTLSRLGSSYGPTRDGRLKPDISAPGGVVIATGNARFISDAINSGNPANYQKVAWTGKHVRNSGTSMAAPMVSGAVALYLQKYPTANWQEIKQAFISTARKDSFTTQTPNIAYGNGKLNAFTAIQSEFITGCTDTGSINYDPSANIDNGTCIAKVYGCMDVEANNYDASANMPSLCTYDSLPNGVTNIKATEAFANVYPNPSNGKAVVYYQLTDEMVGNTQLLLTDLLGRTVLTIPINSTKGYLPLENTGKGVYLYHLQYGNESLSRRKLVIY